MPEDRRLAAIMFTDIVGYTRLMGKDEDQAFNILRKNREIQRPIIKKYRGEWLKEMGDGILASFSTSSDAVRCSLDIQKACKDVNILLRVGIHEGEVVFEGSDVLGDGVNIASRLEEIAEVGCINVSGAVYKDIKNKAGISAVFIEEKTLKNVDEPIKVYKIYNMEIENDIAEEESPKRPLKPSIAVLPFVNMSADPEQEYFCDGISEEIINALSHVEGLKVIARTSAFMFKGKHEDMREIGKKLDVETLLEGSVRKAGNRLRITVQLIKVSDGSHIWSEAYNRELKDVFAIQEEISLAIVENLKIKLLGEEKTAMLKRYTDNLEAYNLYLKGSYYSQMLTVDGIKKAFEYYNQAIQKDPDYALAYIGMASNYWIGSYYGRIPPNEAYPVAKDYVGKALELDKSLTEAHSVLGGIYMNYDWNWKAAEQEFKLAIQYNPNHALTHLFYSFFLTINGRYDEAIVEVMRAQELDPLSIYINSHVGFILYFSKQYDRALKELNMTLAMNPNYHLTHYFLGIIYSSKEMLKEAIERYGKAVELSGENPFTVAGLACLKYRSGEKEQAKKLMDSLKQKSEKEYVTPMSFYLFYRMQNNFDQALHYIERAIEEHDSYLPWLLVHPFDRFRIPDEPRFNELLEKAGLGF